MERFALRWNGAGPAPQTLPAEVAAENWMNAVSDVVEGLRIAGLQAQALACDIRPDGTMEVEDPRAGIAFTVHRIDDEDTGDEDTEVDEHRFGPATAGAAVMLVGTASHPTDEDTQPIHQAVEEVDPTAEMVIKPGTFDALADAPDAPNRFSTDNLADALKAEAKQLASLSWPTEAAGAALDLLLRELPAESASVLLHDSSKHCLVFVAARGPRAGSLAGMSIPANAGIAGMVFATGTSMMVREPSEDPQHYDGIDAKTGYDTQALLAVPVSDGERITGVLELLNPFGQTGFVPHHADAALVVAQGLGAAAKNP